jgi:Lsr2
MSAIQTQREGTHFVAQKVAVTYTDDLDGSKAAETVAFALDGASYEIDLSARNAKALRKALSEFQEAARPLPPSGVFGPRGGVRPKAATRSRRSTSARTAVGPAAATGGGASPSSAEVRTWAAANGVAVPSRGRVPESVREQYAAAHAG